MFNPDVRAVLIDALRPPVGMRLARAVATTFTLDLETAMTIPLAFATHRLRDPEDSVGVMEAIRECADRIDVFAQAGQLKTPLTRSPLFAFLEPVVHLVAAPGRLFHPKIWLVRYAEPDSTASVMRLLVLTRNLTADRSWDLCLSLEGVRGTRPDTANKPMADLVRWCLANQTGPSLDTARRAEVNGLIEDVRRTKWDLPDKVASLSFHALGVTGASIPDLGGRRHLVISPFLTEGGLVRVSPSRHPAVISRQEELDRLPPEVTDQLDAYVLDEAAALKDDASTDSKAGILAGLHAKAYIAEYGSRARLTVGSSNATDAGWGRNIEFLVQMEGARKDFSIDSVLGKDGMGEMLLPYVRQPCAQADEALRDLEASLTVVAAMDFDAEVSGDRDRWQLTLTTQAVVVLPDGISLGAGLLTRRGDGQQIYNNKTVETSFTDLRTVDITPFVVLTAKSGDLAASTVVRATLTNDPADRLDTVLAAQVDSPEKFLRWLYLLLGQSALLLELGVDTSEGGKSTLWERLSTRGLFETLVTGLADSPHQLGDVSRFVDRVRSTEQGRNVLPPGFLDVWDLVDSVRLERVAVGGGSQ